MADTVATRVKLNDEQKAEVRAAIAQYKKSHPESRLKEILAHLDVPYRDQVTEGVLRGLAARSPRAGKGTRRNSNTTRLGTSIGRSRKKPAVPTGRGRRLDRMVEDLTSLRQRRNDLDVQIREFEEELRERLQQALGSEYVAHIFDKTISG
jgi:hypothetical protein